MSEKQLFEDGSVSDRPNYDELRKGYPSADAANDAVQGFWKELYELRNKYRISDVHVILSFTIAGQGDMLMAMHAGNELMQEPMAAWALGQAAASRQENIARLLSQAKSVKRQPNKK